MRSDTRCLHVVLRPQVTEIFCLYLIVGIERRSARSVSVEEDVQSYLMSLSTVPMDIIDVVPSRHLKVWRCR